MSTEDLPRELGEGYVLSTGVPDTETYLTLRRRAGLSAFTPEAARLGLPNTWYGVTVTYEDRPVGMGRVIGDGGCFFQLVDIAVDPDHQGRGLGTAVVRALVDHLEATAPATAYVSLIADVEGFYERFGFEPVGPKATGMARRTD